MHACGWLAMRSAQMKLAGLLAKERVWVMMEKDFTPQTKVKENRPPPDVLIHIQSALWYPAWEKNQASTPPVSLLLSKPLLFK